MKKRSAKGLLSWLIAIGALAVFLAVLLILKTSSSVSEWMAKNISRGYISIAGRITGILPFSLYETLIYVAVLGVIALIAFSIVFFVKRKKMKAVKLLLVIPIAALVFGNLYTLSAGFAYNRDDADVPLYQAVTLTENDLDELKEIASFMVDDFNYVSSLMKRDESGMTVSPYTLKELSDKLKEEYKRLDSEYYSSFTPRAKAITSKNIMTNMHITGVFFAPFGEANVNPLTPAPEMPVTMAHELAHSKGAMRENEANLTAYWLTVTSDDPYLRYSGYRSCYESLIRAVGDLDPQYGDELYSRLDEKIFKETMLISRFWSSYTLLDDITEKFNDFYLKLQGQKDGTDSYYEPFNPPGEIVVPPEPGGDDEPQIQVVCNLNTVQRMMIRAVKERKEGATL